MRSPLRIAIPARSPLFFRPTETGTLLIVDATAATTPTSGPPRRPTLPARALVVGLPALLQAATIWALIVANTGNGSFVGLGALVLGVPLLLVCLPISLAWAHRHPDRPSAALAGALATAFLLPVALLGAFWLWGFVVTELGLHK